MWGKRFDLVLQATTEGTGGGASTAPGTEAAGTGGTQGGTGQTTTGTPAGDQAATGTGQQQQQGTGTTQEPGSTAGAADAAPKAPEKYELTVPDQAQPYVDSKLVERVEQFARANNWSNEDAQAALDEQIALVGAQAEAFRQETLADPTYGGDKFAETQRLAQKAIDRIRPAGHARRDSFNAFITRGGHGNNIEVVSFLADLGRMMAEDSVVSGSSSSGTVTDADRLYDHPDSRRLAQR